MGEGMGQRCASRRGRGNPGVGRKKLGIAVPRAADSPRCTMLVHTVYFWLRPDLTADQRADFRRGVESLGGIAAVKAIYVGTPAKTTKRPIIDDSYSVALTVVCEGVAGHDAYQVDPLHLAFVERFKTFWTRVQIYDAE